LLEAHGGTVSAATSQAEVRSSLGASSEDTQNGDITMSGECVLIIDDEEAIRRFLRVALNGNPIRL